VPSAAILEKSMGARNRVGVRLSHRPARLHRLPDWIPGVLKKFKNTVSGLCLNTIQFKLDGFHRVQAV
jgi:hypothetical protein